MEKTKEYQKLRFTKAANSSSSSTASVDDFNPEQTQVSWSQTGRSGAGWRGKLCRSPCKLRHSNQGSNSDVIGMVFHAKSASASEGFEPAK